MIHLFLNFKKLNLFYYPLNDIANLLSREEKNSSNRTVEAQSITTNILHEILKICSHPDNYICIVILWNDIYRLKDTFFYQDFMV